MKCVAVLGAAVCFLGVGAPRTSAQTFPAPDYFRHILEQPPATSQLPGPTGLRDFVVQGKVRLALEDAIRLVLLNNTDVRVSELPVESARYAIQRAYAPFDPVSTSSFNALRAVSPTYSQLQGAPTLSNLTQQTQSGYAQTFETGTQYQINFNASKSSTNSSFYFFNPSIFSSLDFSLTQPLLRNRGLFPNRAPIVIAQRSLRQSRDGFEASVNDTIRQAVNQYWAVVQARENLKVLQKSYELAQASYNRDKRALELGALPPLDIYRSESEVAARRVSVIQAEYFLKQTEDQFRRAIGADLDPYVRALDLELVESAEPTGELASIDEKTALQQAMARRPEIAGLREELANDATEIRLAHNELLPDLSLSGFFSSQGLGGNQIATGSGPIGSLQPGLVTQGGFHQALNQIFSFNFPSYGFTLRLNLPVRNRAAEADLGNALVARRRSLYLLRQTQQAITLEVATAVHQLEEAKVAMAAAKVALDLAQKTLEAEQRKYELGAQTIFFVLEAQSALQTAEQSMVQSEINYQTAVTAVDHATGTLLERHRVQIAAVH